MSPHKRGPKNRTILMLIDDFQTLSLTGLVLYNHSCAGELKAKASTSVKKYLPRYITCV